MCIIHKGFSGFRAVAIVGVKLKVPSDQLEFARKILRYIKKGFLFDEKGECPITEALHSEYAKQQEVLRIKSNRFDILIQDSKRTESF